jgi:hypothetical protein
MWYDSFEKYEFGLFLNFFFFWLKKPHVVACFGKSISAVFFWKTSSNTLFSCDAFSNRWLQLWKMSFTQIALGTEAGTIETIYRETDGLV